MDHLGSEDFWLFGYGSLIWKPPPHFGRIGAAALALVLTIWAHVGQTNAFQATLRVMFGVSGRRGEDLWTRLSRCVDQTCVSEDHRGTPDSPGRVVTLIQRSFWETLDDPQRQTEGAFVWGVAYHIIPSRVQEVKEYLDIREINGYSIQYTPFHPADSSLADLHCLVYIGMPDNPQFLGALPPQEVAETINASVGPSGENREYLLHLEHALKDLSPDSYDEHITDLARRVRALTPPSRSSRPLISHDMNTLRKVNSTEEQEEIEKEL